MTLTLDRPPAETETDQLLVLTPDEPPAITPDVARVLLRMLRTAVPDLGCPGPGGPALGA